MWLWLEPGAKFIIFQEGSVYLQPENHLSDEKVLATTKSDAILANVPKTICFLLFLSSRKGKFCAIQDDVKIAPVPDLKLDTFTVPLEARIEPWLEREALPPFSPGRLEISKNYNLRTLSDPSKCSDPYC